MHVPIQFLTGNTRVVIRLISTETSGLRVSGVILLFSVGTAVL